MGDVDLNPMMMLAGLPMLLVGIWFVLERKSVVESVFGSLIILTFTSGTLEIFGISPSILRLATEILVVFLFFISIFYRKSGARNALPGLVPLFIFVFIGLVSVLISQLSLPLYILFLRDYIFIFLLFYTILNLNLNFHDMKVSYKLVVYSVLAQIFANLVKYFIVGISERYVGSMAVLGGSLTVIFSLVGCLFAIVLYWHLRKKRYLLAFLGLILFAIIGYKRAAIVYIPFVYLFLLVYYQFLKGGDVTKLMKQGLFLALFGLVLVYVSVRVMPTFNPDREVWGRFDIDYAINYSRLYLTGNDSVIERVGRSEAPWYLLSMVWSDSPVSFFLGSGAGHLVKSSFNPLVSEAGSLQGLTYDLYGVGYAARTAFLQLFLQVGVIGLAAYLWGMARIYRSSVAAVGKHVSAKFRIPMRLLLAGCMCVFLIDFFTYSVVLTGINGAAILIACLLALSRREDGIYLFSRAGSSCTR